MGLCDGRITLLLLSQKPEIRISRDSDRSLMSVTGGGGCWLQVRPRDYEVGETSRTGTEDRVYRVGTASLSHTLN